MSFFQTIKSWFNDDRPPVISLPDIKELTPGYLINYFGVWTIQAKHDMMLGNNPVIDYHLESAEGKQRRFHIHHNRHRLGEEFPVLGVSFEGLTGDIRDLLNSEKPPSDLKKNDIHYLLNETGVGKIHQEDFIYWEYVDKEDQHFVRYEQFGEHDFVCIVGEEINPLHIEILGDPNM